MTGRGIREDDPSVLCVDLVGVPLCKYLLNGVHFNVCIILHGKT